MAKKSPEMQLLLLKQAEKQAKEDARVAREKAKAERFAAYLALQQQYADNKAKALELRAQQVSKPRTRKLTVAEAEDARIAELTRQFILANPHLAPVPYEAPPLNPDAREIDVDAAVMRQAQHAADIEAARKAWNEKQHEEWLAAQRTPDPEDDTPRPPKPPKPPLNETDAGNGDDMEPEPTP